MKIFPVIFLYLFFNTNAAEAADTLYFSGNIKVSKKITYKYTLRFTINNYSKLTGYSLTDPGGPNETKTRISGSYDSLNKVVTFEEKDVLRSKVDLQKNDLCFVKASLVLKKNKLVETLSGKFTGFGVDKATQCASGEIQLINTDKVKIILKRMNEPDELPKKLSPVEKKDSNNVVKRENKPDELPKNLNPAEKKSNTNVVKISDEKGKEFEITGDKIKLSIWDNGQVDGDRISILLNGEFILENYSAGTVKKIIEITLTDKGVDTLKFIALNEGDIPPNTAAILIESPFEQYRIMTEAKLNEVRTIYLRKKLHKSN